MLLTILPVLASAQVSTKEEAYAGMLFSISRYVVWERIEGDFDILILGQPKLAAQMKTLYANRKVGDAKVNIIEDKTTRTDFRGIEMLISTNKAPLELNLLTVNLDNTKAIVNFVQEGGKIKVKIRKNDGEKVRLRFSNNLLQIVQQID